jgi:hypothetical protein
MADTKPSLLLLSSHQPGGAAGEEVDPPFALAGLLLRTSLLQNL